MSPLLLCWGVGAWPWGQVSNGALLGPPRPYWCITGDKGLSWDPLAGDADRRSHLRSPISEYVGGGASGTPPPTLYLRNSILNPQIWRFDYGSLVCTRETPAFDEDRVPSHHAQHPLLSDGAVRSPWGNA